MRILLLGFFSLFASIAPSRAENSAELTAKWFVGAQRPSGLFDFDLDFLSGQGAEAGTTDISRAAFVIRQALGAYSLAKYYAASRDTALRQPIAAVITALGRQNYAIDRPWSQRAIEWTGLLSLPVLRVSLAGGLHTLGLLYSEGGPGLLLAYEGKPATVWTGATALALAAELTYARATGEQEFAPLRAGWTTGLLMRRIPGGGFRDFLRSISADPYVDGEAWLALALLAAADPSGFANMTVDIDAYMMRTYVAAAGDGFFHWGAMAARQRYATTKDPAFPRFVAAMLPAILSRPLSPDDNTCPLLEGLAAGLGLLRDARFADAALIIATEQRVKIELEKNLGLQLQLGQERIALAGEAVLIAPKIASQAGAWLFGRFTPRIRVDMTGHCLSALVELGQFGSVAPRSQ